MAATFDFAHPALGQEVAAAVVMEPGNKSSSAEIRAFVAQRLSFEKVPKRVFVLEELPRGTTSKIKRHLLEKLIIHR